MSATASSHELPIPHSLPTNRPHALCEKKTSERKVMHLKENVSAACRTTEQCVRDCMARHSAMSLHAIADESGISVTFAVQIVTDLVGRGEAEILRPVSADALDPDWEYCRLIRESDNDYLWQQQITGWGLGEHERVRHRGAIPPPVAPERELAVNNLRMAFAPI